MSKYVLYGDRMFSIAREAFVFHMFTSENIFCSVSMKIHVVIIQGRRFFMMLIKAGLVVIRKVSILRNF